MKPKVLNLRKHGIPENSVYIGRSRKGEPQNPFGNPFEMHNRSDCERDRVIRRYREWLMQQPELIERVRRELRGRDLVCFCSPKRCHGDLLLAIANGLDEAEPAGQAGLPGI